MTPDSGVVFHALLNISGTLTNHSVLWDSVAIGVIAIVLTACIMVLHKRLVNSGRQ